MVSSVTRPRLPLRGVFLVALAVALPWLYLGPSAEGTQGKPSTLLIGSSGSITSQSNPKKEKSDLQSLKDFIKEETGMTNEIETEKDWRELTYKMVKKQVQLGVYQGYEFAWAVAKQPGLKPLALSVNVYVYPVAYVVAQRSGKAKTFADLQGQTLAIPSNGQRFLRLFVERKAQEAGKKAEEFFAKITAPVEIEDTLDDVVDGKVQAAVADRAALEGYKRRKPGRFAKLREVAKSQRFPPPLVAYYDGSLDQATLTRFQKGLLNASKKERGQTMLTLFRLTGFATIPSDFAQVLAETRKDYPPPAPDAE